jgi:hypothetical protein
MVRKLRPLEWRREGGIEAACAPPSSEDCYRIGSASYQYCPRSPIQCASQAPQYVRVAWGAVAILSARLGAKKLLDRGLQLGE